MRILVSGATGLIGAAFTDFMRAEGAEVATLARTPADNAEPTHRYWDPARAILDPRDLEGFDAVVHLAGENIASGRWTQEKKERIFNSRVRGTALLSTTLAACKHPPHTLVCASAIGYYGNRGEEVLDESAAPGQGFLAETCVAWEAAAGPAVDAGLRVVHLRTGMVLSGRGGALSHMLPPFRLGLGGPIGSGRAWMSWIALEDMMGLIRFCLREASLSGPVNAVAPHPVRNREFTRALGRALRRPALFPVPPLLLRLAFGEMAGELILSSAHVVPRRLQDADFAWQYPGIEAALRACLGTGQDQ